MTKIAKSYIPFTFFEIFRLKGKTRIGAYFETKKDKQNNLCLSFKADFGLIQRKVTKNLKVRHQPELDKYSEACSKYEQIKPELERAKNELD